MSKDVLTEIVELCLAVDRQAMSVYERLAFVFHDTELGGFWQQMSEEEAGHVLFWEKFAELTRDGMIPQVFDQPYEIRAELESLQGRVRRLAEGCCTAPSVGNAFVLAYRMEFYLLHPAFSTLFHFARNLESVTGVPTPETEYEQHIERFIDTLARFGGASQEMELVGELLVRLWEDSRELAARVDTDMLTGALNRRGFFQTVRPLLHLARRNGFKVGVMMLDIDDFKAVNDTRGHPVGDAVLCSVAETFAGQLRTSDIVGRYGGEEFVAFLSPVDPEEFEHVAERVRRAVASSDHGGVEVTVSIGLALDEAGEADEEFLQALIKRSDDCLYTAKRQGKNQVAGGTCDTLG